MDEVLGVCIAKLSESGFTGFKDDRIRGQFLCISYMPYVVSIVLCYQVFLAAAQRRNGSKK